MDVQVEGGVTERGREEGWGAGRRCRCTMRRRLGMQVLRAHDAM